MASERALLQSERAELQEEVTALRDEVVKQEQDNLSSAQEKLTIQETLTLTAEQRNKVTLRAGNYRPVAGQISVL